MKPLLLSKNAYDLQSSPKLFLTAAVLVFLYPCIKRNHFGYNSQPVVGSLLLNASYYMDWYEEEVQQLIEKREHMPYLPQAVFYGSSTIRLWENLTEDFKYYLPVNLGFGGSTLEACVYYFDWLVKPVKTANKIVIYAGDNDLGDGRSPDEVLIFFRQLKSLVADNFPAIPCYYISIKPSISRWNINENIKLANQLIQNEIETPGNQFSFVNIYDSMLAKDGHPDASFYDEDGLHLSPKGYEVWKEVLLAQVFEK